MNASRYFKATNSSVSRPFMNWILACLCLFAATLAHADEKVGTVTTSHGKATITRAGATITAAIGTELKPTDTLHTGEASNLSIALADGTRVLLGPNSQLAMESYAFNPETKKGNMAFNFAKGTMRMITGAITKTSPDQAILKTPSATAGIRGTDFIVDVPSVK